LSEQTRHSASWPRVWRTPEHIAAVICGAATDATNRLRYFAGDDVKHLVEARRKLSDEKYETYMRGQFA
jgi:hypothetical protein